MCSRFAPTNVSSETKYLPTLPNETGKSTVGWFHGCKTLRPLRRIFAPFAVKKELYFFLNLLIPNSGYQLPESKQIMSALLNMDAQQWELYGIVQKKILGCCKDENGCANLWTKTIHTIPHSPFQSPFRNLPEFLQI